VSENVYDESIGAIHVYKNMQKIKNLHYQDIYQVYLHIHDKINQKWYMI
jgi:hypothetical protein